ncbi:MAG TPA: hypothetical protein VFK31_02855 [Rhodanobacteraceae bacterium]|nr:hypothetical protein [Rhodanobacteraceae bacterium]
MNLRHGLWPMALILLMAGCGQQVGTPASETATAASTASPATAASADRIAVRDVVERFGKQMQKVSVLAPPDAMRPQLKKVYGDLLTPDLLRAWLADPSQAVGRDVSSPWPAGIDIDRIDCPTAIRCRVQGSVRYVTSNEVEHGGVAMRRPVRLHVERENRDWRIAAVEIVKP